MKIILVNDSLLNIMGLSEKFIEIETKADKNK